MKTEKSVPERCEIIQKVQRVLGGKWKIEILYYIGFQDIHRFGALRRHIGGISESSLINQLRSLEEDGFISRHDYKELPPRGIFPDRPGTELHAHNGTRKGLGGDSPFPLILIQIVSLSAF